MLVKGFERCGSGLIAGLAALILVLLLTMLPTTALAVPTTQLTIKKLASDGTTILAQRTVDYHWLMNPVNLPVLGDGNTHYYHQGPVFANGTDEATEQQLRWNAAEDTNVKEKDMGALKGTNVKDLCNLVGGMKPGETLKVKAADGLSKTFAYRNVYEYSKREGPMVICWYNGGSYPDTGFREGMRLVWFADTSINPWGIHVFGNWDWHEAAQPQYWYFYHSGSEKYPTTTGLAVQNVSELIVYSHQAAAKPAPPSSAPSAEVVSAPVATFTADHTSGPAPLKVQFRDQSVNGPTMYAWDFENDGTVDSTVPNPIHEYPEEGNYDVKLVVTNGAGSDEEVKADYIVVGPASPIGVQTVTDPAEVPLASAGDSGREHLVLLLFGLICAVCIGFLVWKLKLKQTGSQ